MTAPAPTHPDRLVLPVLHALRDSAAVQLAYIGRPVCAFPLYISDHLPPAADCDCTCAGGGQGSAWARYVQAVPRATDANLPTPCAAGGMVSITVELGVWRCAPSPSGDSASIPDAELDPWTAGMLADQTALRRAFACSPWLHEHDVPWRLVSMRALGPRGGCSGVAVQAVVDRDDCGCPPVGSTT